MTKPEKKVAMAWTVMDTLSEMPSWIRFTSWEIRFVTSPAPRRSKKAIF